MTPPPLPDTLPAPTVGVALPPPPGAAPVSTRERIVAIDVLRGIAVLGILVMNIQSFSMPVSAYSYPWSWGDMTGTNGAVYFLSHILASGKFISIFSILFGAGIILQNQRVGGALSAHIHFRRMFILIGFGLAHAYLLWYGDILFTYGVLGMLAFALRPFSARTLTLVAGAFFVAGLVMNLAISFAMYAAGGMDKEFNPSAATQLIEVQNYTGSWLMQMRERAPTAILSQTYVLLSYCLPFVTALMLLGMALLKSGFFTGGWPRRRYVVTAVAGVAVGWSLSAAQLWIDSATGRQPTLSVMVLGHLNTLAMVPTALGYSAAVMLLARSSAAAHLRPLAAVGRTALSCYLLESLICTTLFYGHGLGWFGTVERTGQIVITLGVWIVLIALATFWTRFFRYGPAEWIWRAMTYGWARV